MKGTVLWIVTHYRYDTKYSYITIIFVASSPLYLATLPDCNIL